MKWIKIGLVLSLLLFPLMGYGWKSGCPCYKEEVWIDEYRCDTITPQMFACILSVTDGAVLSGQPFFNKSYLFLYHIYDDEGFAFPIQRIILGDSMVVDSIYSNWLIELDSFQSTDTIYVGLDTATIKGSGQFIDDNYYQAVGDIYTGLFAANTRFSFVSQLNWSFKRNTKNSPYLRYYFDETGGARIANRGLIVYYTAFYRRYGRP